MTSTAAAMQQRQHQHQKPRFSPGTNEEASWAALEPLLSPDGNGNVIVGAAAAAGRWTLAKDGEALERTFRFKTFAKTWVRRLSSSSTPSSFPFPSLTPSSFSFLFHFRSSSFSSSPPLSLLF